MAITPEVIFCALPSQKTNKYQGSFRINGDRTYNTLPRIIRQVETLGEFKIKLKPVVHVVFVTKLIV